jgi:hypothetical protein
MRKTLVVLALMLSYVLLLQSPAWAPNLYSLDQTGGQSSGPGGKRVAVVQGKSDCKSQSVTIGFTWGETRTVAADAQGDFAVALIQIPAGHGPVTIDDHNRFSCGTLAFTGTASVRLLAFGVSLLVAGALLLLLSRRPVR